jgi:hypothetical protein
MDLETPNRAAEQTTATKPDAEWALVEIMGHRRHYGGIAEVSRFGAVMLQVDEPTAEPAIFNRFYYAALALFALTPCSEADARMGAERMRPKPWVPYRQPAMIEQDEDEIGAANEPTADHRENDPNQDDMAF